MFGCYISRIRDFGVFPVTKKAFIKNGTNWQWQSLTHKSISRSGLFAGGTVNYEVNTSIPEIGVYNAGMQLNYTITISVLCKGAPLGASGTYTTNSRIWNVND